MDAQKKTHSAFTLIEVLVVIVIIGIIATIAVVTYPSMSARSKVSKLVSTAKKIQEGFELEAINGKALPTTSFCLNYNSEDACMMDYDAETGHWSHTPITTDQSALDDLNQSFSIKNSGESNYFHSSDFVYLNKLNLYDVDCSETYGCSQDTFGEHPALIYFIGDQTDCQNDDAIWFLKNEHGTTQPLAKKPTDNIINNAPDGWSFQQYESYPVNDSKSVNYCVIIIHRPNIPYNNKRPVYT